MASSNMRVTEEKKESFFERMKSDKKYSAKVQLIGYGVFIVILVIGINLSSMGSGSSGNVIGAGEFSEGSSDVENTSRDDTGLLESLADNYSYDIVVDVDKKSMNTETNEEVLVSSSVNYRGKSYDNTLEINRVVNGEEELYYRVDNDYYSMVDNITSLVKEAQVYDVVEAKYIELDSIMDFIDKASLDHVTEFSSGKKEYVYHLSIKDVIVSHHSNISVDDKLEIYVVEENGVLNISIDYSSVYGFIDESVSSCKLVATIGDIGKVEEFDVVVSKLDEKQEDGEEQEINQDGENTSLE